MTNVAEKSDTATTGEGDRLTEQTHEPEMNAGEDFEAARIQDLTVALAGRDRFIGLIGHELRNSLAPMVLLAEQFGVLAEGSQPPGKLLARVAMLTNNLNKLMGTINRIVEVADLRRGKLQLAPSVTDMVDVVGEVCGELEREAAAAGAILVIDTSGPVVGRWDRARIKQIVSNLVSNAIRYGGGGRIEITVVTEGDDGELVVRDHGPGLDPQEAARLFDSFDRPASKRVSGLGLGLWVVNTLCNAMGGTVSVVNCPDGGARFCVVLPRG